MKTIKVKRWREIPENFTGIAELPSGTKEWYKDGKRHREDGPAVEWESGYKEWYLEGKLHREDGPAIEDPNGTKSWYLDGLAHREDGPAKEWPDGEKHWFKDGKRHREDGPAIELPNGPEWWYLEDEDYDQINLENYIVLDYCKGEYGIMWHKLLGKDNVFEYPDIPGLIEK